MDVINNSLSTSHTGNGNNNSLPKGKPSQESVSSYIAEGERYGSFSTDKNKNILKREALLKEWNSRKSDPYIETKNKVQSNSSVDIPCSSEISASDSVPHPKKKMKFSKRPLTTKENENADKPSKKDVNGNTPLHNAVNTGKEDEIKKLLTEYGTNINSTNEFGHTALHLAVMKNNLKVVNLLIAAGADKSIKSYFGDGKTALDIAKVMQNKSIILALQDDRRNEIIVID